MLLTLALDIAVSHFFNIFIYMFFKWGENSIKLISYFT